MISASVHTTTANNSCAPAANQYIKPGCCKVVTHKGSSAATANPLKATRRGASTTAAITITTAITNTARSCSTRLPRGNHNTPSTPQRHPIVSAPATNARPHRDKPAVPAGNATKRR